LITRFDTEESSIQKIKNSSIHQEIILSLFDFSILCYVLQYFCIEIRFLSFVDALYTNYSYQCVISTCAKFEASSWNLDAFAELTKPWTKKTTGCDELILSQLSFIAIFLFVRLKEK